MASIHRDPHKGNLMQRSVAGTVYAGRPWLYVIEDADDSLTRYYIIPPHIHRDTFLEIIDMDHSVLGAAPRDGGPDIRYDFQFALHGWQADREGMQNGEYYDPLKVADPTTFFDATKSQYAEEASIVGADLRRALLKDTQRLSLPSLVLGEWPERLRDATLRWVRGVRPGYLGERFAPPTQGS